MALANEIRIGEQTRTGKAGFVRSLQDAIARRKVYRETVRELRQLSNRDLNDLGISASMITRVANEAAYGTK